MYWFEVKMVFAAIAAPVQGACDHVVSGMYSGMFTIVGVNEGGKLDVSS